MKSADDLSRRDFLSLMLRILLYLSGSLLALALLRFFGYIQPETKTRQRLLGKAQDYPPGTGKVFPEEKVYLVHIEQGFRAYSLICPHLGCIVQQQPDGSFRCPCHGSAFDRQGERIKGPAARSLERLRVEIGPQGDVIMTE